mmetsp:Transcript_20816/g.44171  ORF Transcript_20816/g.44171 Transcript_20816/m.44171 type:complete len:147 (+) Transcript_20816:90-530(+)
MIYRHDRLSCQTRCNILKSTINHSHPTPTPYYCYQIIRASSNESSKNWTSECSVADTLSFFDELNTIAVIDVLSSPFPVIKDQRRCPIVPIVDQTRNCSTVIILTTPLPPRNLLSPSSSSSPPSSSVGSSGPPPGCNLRFPYILID